MALAPCYLSIDLRQKLEHSHSRSCLRVDLTFRPPCSKRIGLRAVKISSLECTNRRSRTCTPPQGCSPPSWGGRSRQDRRSSPRSLSMRTWEHHNDDLSIDGALLLALIVDDRNTWFLIKLTRKIMWERYKKEDLVLLWTHRVFVWEYRGCYKMIVMIMTNEWI